MKRQMLYALAALGLLIGGVMLAAAATNKTTAPTPVLATGAAEPAEAPDASGPSEHAGAAEKDGVDHAFDGEEDHTD